MLEQFEEFVIKNQLFTKTDKVLLAISGGIDSTALFHLLRLGNFNFACAHCNYGLRGEESERDESFVKHLTQSHKIQLHGIRFDTLRECDIRGKGIQETARELRYEWFEQLHLELGYAYVLTAHNKNDNTETLLFNLSRSTGIAGLHGIPIKKGHLTRPLIFAERKEIAEFINSNQFEHCEDSSNADDKYQRNKLRHQVIPQWELIRPDLHQSVFNTTKMVQGYENLANHFIFARWQELKENLSGGFRIDLADLLQIPETAQFLYHNLKSKGFSFSQCTDIIDSMKHSESRYFESGDFYIEKSGKYLYFQSSENEKSPEIIIDGHNNKHRNEYYEILVHEIEVNQVDYQLPCLYLDKDCCCFPLKIRHWIAGDKMIPLGMKGHKNISDILTDLKIPHRLKQKCLVIEDAENKIIALLPDRPSEEVKINDNTSKVLCLRLINL